MLIRLILGSILRFVDGFPEFSGFYYNVNLILSCSGFFVAILVNAFCEFVDGYHTDLNFRPFRFLCLLVSRLVALSAACIVFSIAGAYLPYQAFNSIKSLFNEGAVLFGIDLIINAYLLFWGPTGPNGGVFVDTVSEAEEEKEAREICWFIADIFLLLYSCFGYVDARFFDVRHLFAGPFILDEALGTWLVLLYASLATYKLGCVIAFFISTFVETFQS